MRNWVRVTSQRALMINVKCDCKKASGSFVTAPPSYQRLDTAPATTNYKETKLISISQEVIRGKQSKHNRSHPFP